jgi:hypothetical protein
MAFIPSVFMAKKDFIYMERTKLMPRHLLLIAVPLIVAFLGGLLFSGNFNNFMQERGGISTAQQFIGISLLCGTLAFSLKCLPKPFSWAIIIFSPLLMALLTILKTGGGQNLAITFMLNLLFTVGLWGVLQLTFFAKSMLKIRTAAFALLASVLLTLYFRVLFFFLKMPFSKADWTTYFMNALFLFIFIGFGLSLADVSIIRKEVEEAKRQKRTQEDDETDDQ